MKKVNCLNRCHRIYWYSDTIYTCKRHASISDTKTHHTFSQHKLVRGENAEMRKCVRFRFKMTLFKNYKSICEATKGETRQAESFWNCFFDVDAVHKSAVRYANSKRQPCSKAFWFAHCQQNVELLQKTKVAK